MGPVEDEWVETNPDGTRVIHHRQRYQKKLLIPQLIGLAVIVFVLLGVWSISFRLIPGEVERVMQPKDQTVPEAEQVVVGEDGKRYIVISRKETDAGGA